MEQFSPQSGRSTMLAPYRQTLIGLAMLLFIFVVFWFMGQRKTAQVNESIDTSTYQIVTLDSGRSYFGKLSGLDEEYILLANAFFLKANEPQLDENGEAIEPEEGDLPFTLQRIGNQVYEPTDDVYLKSEHVLSWQNLNKDSSVVTAINEYLETKE
ncbi:MAG: hypothetical protein HYV32_00095 [Candidatus Kerfeldbacteria bacterium]|nr:hypothetical protein [Candidatus Kerfeldbacteria bacterium]